ncbi:MAG TPA: methionine--tRNA ligase, partial [Isosphaeraceae bacterium]
TAWRGGLDLPAVVADLRELVGSFQYNVALQRIWLEVVDAANRYITATEPFKLIKSDPAACRVVLINLAEWLRVAAILIKPFLPRTAETFYAAFSFGDDRPWSEVGYDALLVTGRGAEWRVTAPLTGGKVSPLFPKIDLKAAGG